MYHVWIQQNATVVNGRILLEQALMQQIKDYVRLCAGSYKAATNSHCYRVLCSKWNISFSVLSARTG